MCKLETIPNKKEIQLCECEAFMCYLENKLKCGRNMGGLNASNIEMIEL